MVSKRGRLAHTRALRKLAELKMAESGCPLQRLMQSWLWLTRLHPAL